MKMRELLLNAGAAATAARNGISKDDIKLLGRWKSDAVDVYINELQKPDHMHKLLALNSQLFTPLHYLSGIFNGIANSSHLNYSFLA